MPLRTPLVTILIGVSCISAKATATCTASDFIGMSSTQSANRSARDQATCLSVDGQKRCLTSLDGCLCSHRAVCLELAQLRVQAVHGLEEVRCPEFDLNYALRLEHASPSCWVCIHFYLHKQFPSMTSNLKPQADNCARLCRESVLLDQFWYLLRVDLTVYDDPSPASELGSGWQVNHHGLSVCPQAFDYE